MSNFEDGERWRDLTEKGKLDNVCRALDICVPMEHAIDYARMAYVEFQEYNWEEIPENETSRYSKYFDYEEVYLFIKTAVYDECSSIICDRFTDHMLSHKPTKNYNEDCSINETTERGNNENFILQ